MLAEVTLKVMPKPETTCTILLQSMADGIAIPELSQALNTPYEVSAAAHLPASVARRSGVAAVAEGLGAATALRLEGPAPSVAFRAEAIESLLGHGLRLDGAGTEQFWAEIGRVRPLLESDARCVWRLCPTPTFLGTTLPREYAIAQTSYGWADDIVRDVARTSIEASFATPNIKEKLLSDLRLWSTPAQGPMLRR